MAKLVMVDQILVTEGDAEYALADQRRHRMLDVLRRSAVREAAGEPIDQPDRPIGRAQKQRAGIRCHASAIEAGHHSTALDASKIKQPGITLCRHRGPPSTG